MSKKLSALGAGSLIKLNENGVAKKYLVLGYNHYGKGEVTVLRKDTFAAKAFKASDASYYSNGYNGSCLDEFCNSTHISTLDPVIQACLINVPIPTCIGFFVSGTSNTNVVNLMRKGFALSAMEATGTAGWQAEGSAFPYLSGTQANRIAYYDGTSTAVYWWLRSPGSDARYAYGVGAGGALRDYNVYIASNCCPRPALALSSEILVSNGTDSEGCYTVDDAVIAGEQYQKVNGVWRRMV